MSFISNFMSNLKHLEQSGSRKFVLDCSRVTLIDQNIDHMTERLTNKAMQSTFGCKVSLYHRHSIVENRGCKDEMVTPRSNNTEAGQRFPPSDILYLH